MLTALFLCGADAQVPAEPKASLDQRLKQCAACHGADGISQVPGTPSLAGQPRVFLENYLVLTREGLAGSEVMRQLLKGVTDKDIVSLAKHFSELPPKVQALPVDKKLFDQGRRISANNRCASCHLPDFKGREQMPRLAGQREDFLFGVMRAYQQNKRPGGDTIMAASLYGIPEPDIKALAHYLSRLK